MLSGSTVFSVLLGIIVVVLRESSCHGYQVMASYPLNANSYEDRPIHRPSKPEDYPKIPSDLFGSNSQENSDRSHYHEDNDSSLSSDETSALELPRQVWKRRKGPTLSVVNPLEILRQRLMLDTAQRRMLENQQQIIANAQLLESIGKRSSGLRQSEDLLGEGGYRA